MDAFRWVRAGKIALAAACAAVLGAGAGAPPARAIDFVLVWDDLDENPDFDPNGTRLMAIAEAAAARWERLIVSPGQHEVDVSWSYLDSGQLGLWKFDPFGNNNLYFNANASWFFDPSPHEDSEFDFGSPLDLFDGMRGSELVVSDPEAEFYFDRATPPDTLETAYFGTGISGSAVSDTDLLSVILHEMGHELGIAGDEFSGRYAIYSFHVNGVQDLEVIEENREGSNFGEEHGHLAPPDALMSPNIGPGVRTLPSAVDVLAAARDSGYVEVDLARKFSGVDGAYDDPLVWIGGRVPDSSDHVSILHGGTITVDSPETADSLAIGRNSTLAFTNGGDLAIDHELWVDGFSSIQVPFGSVLSADLLVTEEQARITLAGGELALTTGTLPATAEIAGRGRLTLNGGFFVEGVLRAQGGDLRLGGAGTLGMNAGAIYAGEGNVGIELPFGIGATGELIVSPGRNFSALADLTVPSGVEVRLLGTTANPSFVNSVGSGVDLAIRNLTVGFDGATEHASEITARTVALEGRARLHGDLTLSSPLGTTLRGGLAILGHGRLIQNGDIEVQGGRASVSVDDFDWGNSTASEGHSITIAPNATLDISSRMLGSASNAFRGEIQIDSGVLEIEGLDSGQWSLAPAITLNGVTTPGGTLAMIHSGAADPVVRGDAFSVNDFLLVSGGDAFIEADMTVTPFGDVFVFGNSRLFLAGTTTMNGGSWGGLGALVQRGDIEVVGDTTMAVEEFDWGNSLGLDLHTLAVRSGATFTIDSPGTGEPTNLFRGHVLLEGGELVVNTDSGWSLPAGGAFSRAGSLAMVNDGAVPRIAGQDLEIGGEALVAGGLARIDSNLTLLGSSRVEIGPGATLEATGSNVYRGAIVGDGTLEHRGTTILSSSTPYAISNFVQAGELRALAFGGEATLATQTLLFDSDGTNTLTTDLRIRGFATVEPGAVFTGDGTLIVDERGSLGGSGVVGVDVVNEGVLSPGASPGHLQIGGDYTQTGLLRIELAGPTAREYDRVSFLGHAQLGGTLELILSNGYLPAPGAEFELLRFSRLGSGGAFDEILLPNVGANGFWDLSALYTGGRATFVPEPGTLALVALGLAVLRRRR